MSGPTGYHFKDDETVKGLMSNKQSANFDAHALARFKAFEKFKSRDRPSKLRQAGKWGGQPSRLRQAGKWGGKQAIAGGKFTLQQGWGAVSSKIQEENEDFAVLSKPKEYYDQAKSTVAASKQVYKVGEWTGQKGWKAAKFTGRSAKNGFNFLRGAGYTVKGANAAGGTGVGTAAGGVATGAGTTATGTGVSAGVGAGTTAGGTAAGAGAGAGTAAGGTAAGAGLAAGGWIAVVILIVVVLLVALFGIISSNTSQTQQNATALTGNALKIYQVLIKVPGATPQGVAGVMGNWQIESGLNPTAIQGGAPYSDAWAMDASLGGYAFGVAQWDSGRRVALLNYAKSQGKDWTDLDLQMDYALNHDGSDSTLLKKILTETNTDQAAMDFAQQWERCAPGSYGQRVAAAEKIYGEIAGGGGNIGALNSVVGQSIGNGQCYALASYYVAVSTGNKYNLGAGITTGSRLPAVGDTADASAIGSAYNWASIGWTVTMNPTIADIHPGDILCFPANAPESSSDPAGHVEVVSAVNGNTITAYSQNPGPVRLLTFTFHTGDATSAVHPASPPPTTGASN